MIVAGPEGFETNQYRKFNIKDSDIEPGDDYGMMREVMRRRFSRLMKEAGLDLKSSTADPNEDWGPGQSTDNTPGDSSKAWIPASAGIGGNSDTEQDSTDASSSHPTSDHAGAAAPASAGNSSEQKQLTRREKLKASPHYPDLVLIDGGLGQLHAVMETLQELGLSHHDVTLVSIAKGPDRNAGREKFFRPDKAPFMLPETAPVLYYLQRLRDEVHRWAIGAHRTRRSADIRKNPLDEIEGIGPARKKALLHRFGSAKAIARAKLSDIATVDGVSQALAERIYNYFHGS